MVYGADNILERCEKAMDGDRDNMRNFWKTLGIGMVGMLSNVQLTLINYFCYVKKKVCTNFFNIFFFEYITFDSLYDEAKNYNQRNYGQGFFFKFFNIFFGQWICFQKKSEIFLLLQVHHKWILLPFFHN